MIKNSLPGAVVILLVICGFSQVAYSSYSVEHQTAISGGDEWVESNYKAVLDLLLPNGDASSDEFPSDARWIATVRIEPSNDEPEYGFSLTKFFDGRIEAVVVSARHDSILKQLRNLKRRTPTTNIEQISRMVVVQRQKLISQNCWQMNRLAVSFEALRMSPNVEDDLRLDGTGYAIWLQSRWGNSLKVRLGGPGQHAPTQPHPLLGWIETFRKTIKSCHTAVKK